MPLARANSIEICYETFGSPDDTAVLLLAQYASQLLMWPEPFCKRLAVAGYFVIRYDHRDSGLSTKFDEAGLPDLMEIVSVPVAERASLAPYLLEDMAGDAAQLLDALDVKAAHLVGASMGGMIAQIVASDFPDRALSLTSIMSTPDVAKSPAVPEESATVQLPDDPRIDAKVLSLMGGYRALGTEAFGPSDEELLSFCTACLVRSDHREGAARQVAAIQASPGREEKLADLNIPALIIHGDQDCFVPIIGGELTVDAIPGAEFIGIEGMGHELFSPSLVLIEELLLEHLKKWEAS